MLGVTLKDANGGAPTLFTTLKLEVWSHLTLCNPVSLCIASRMLRVSQKQINATQARPSLPPACQAWERDGELPHSCTNSSTVPLASLQIQCNCCANPPHLSPASRCLRFPCDALHFQSSTLAGELQRFPFPSHITASSLGGSLGLVILAKSGMSHLLRKWICGCLLIPVDLRVVQHCTNLIQYT